MRTTPHRIVVGAIAGMAGPAVFVVAFTVEGLLRPDYDLRGQYVSELALGPRGWVQNLNFMVSGLLIVVFAWGLAALRSMGRAGPILMALIGLALFLSGFFVMDPFVVPRTEWTIRGTVHQLLGALAFTLMPAAGIVLAWRWRRKADWRAFRRWTIAIVMLILLSLVLLRVGPAMPPAAPTIFNPWRGLIQRGVPVPFMLWLFTLAWRVGVVRRSQETPAMNRPARRCGDVGSVPRSPWSGTSG